MHYKKRLIEKITELFQYFPVVVALGARKVGNFTGLLTTHSSGEINHNQLGRELGVDRKTALAWTEIAQATFPWFPIPPFSRNPVKKNFRGT